MNYVLIPTRAGSKGIPGKATKLLAGKPLVLWALEAAVEAVGAAYVIVSTDDEATREVAADIGVCVWHRPDKLATDTATLDEVARDVAIDVADIMPHETFKDDILATVQPTSPFIKAATIRSTIAMMEHYGSVLTVTPDTALRWDDDCQPLYTDRVNRQDADPTYTETGGVIAARLGDILEHGTRIVKPTGLLVLHGAEALDIDTPADWVLAEWYAKEG